MPATFDHVEPLSNVDVEGLSPNNLPNEIEVPPDEVPDTQHTQPNKSPPSVSSRSSRPAPYKDRLPRISLLASSKKIVNWLVPQSIQFCLSCFSPMASFIANVSLRFYLVPNQVMLKGVMFYCPD
ncbi:hypothetical protein WN943_005923 [Citrus x changshan-huyou]